MVKTMNDVNEVLERLIPSAATATKEYSLERMWKLLAALGNPQDKLRVIHVAGTSGKTSTAYYLAALLKAAGHSVGLTSSPHVDSVRERVQIDGQPLSEVRFVRYFNQFLPLQEATKLTPSYFECLIAFAYWLFAKQAVDYAVVEVGLGGRKDATNTVSQRGKVCVITEIGFDHTEILGGTLAKIAYQKAGIIQPGNRVFMYEQASEIMTVIDNMVAEKHADLQILVSPATEDTPEHLPPFQQRNWFLAVQIVESITGRTLNQEQRIAGASITVPARMEHIQVDDKTIILDGSHNGQKMKALVGSLISEFPDQRFGVLAAFVTADSSRAFDAIDEFLPVAENIIFTAFSGKQDHPRVSINPDILSDYVKTKRFVQVRVIKDPVKAYHELLKNDESVLLVTGSFFLMNHVRPLIKELKQRD